MSEFTFAQIERDLVIPNPKPAPTVARASNLPFEIHDYLFTNLVGKGGFAEVYLVKNLKFDTEFVAKVMTIDSSEKDKMWAIFDAECSALSALNHPHVIRIYDRFSVNYQFFCILEYCPGGSLHDEINSVGALSLEQFMAIGSQIVSALQYCHSKGIAHRDIKTGNILFDNNHRVKLADFGLSIKTTAGKMHRSNGGSCLYTAPEIFMHKAHDPMAGDIWALGVVFAIMISGSSPWKCNSIGALRQLAQNGQYTLNKCVPPVVAELISRMIVVDPYKRITMNELSKNPLFSIGNQRRSMPTVPSMPSIKIKWDSIPRASADSDFSYDGNLCQMDDDVGRIQLSKLNTVSSSFMHTIPTRKRMKRSCLPPMLVRTFGGCDDHIKEI